MATSSSRRQVPTRCFFYDKGWCKSGDQCRFTHVESDSRPNTTHGANGEGAAVGATTITTPSSNLVACRFFTKGKCSKGQKCQFLHTRHADANTTGGGNQTPREAHTNTPEWNDRPAKRSKSPKAAATATSAASAPGSFSSTGSGRGGGGAGFAGAGKGGLNASSSSSGGDLEGSLRVHGTRSGAGAGRAAAQVQAQAEAEAEPRPPAKLAVSWLHAVTGGTTAGVRSTSSSNNSNNGNNNTNDYDNKNSETEGQESQAAAAARALLASVKAESTSATNAATRAAKSIQLMEAAVQSALATPRSAPVSKAAAAAAATRSRGGSSGVPCTFFARGKCKYGESCRFSHEITQSRQPRSRGAGAEESKEDTDCGHYEGGDGGEGEEEEDWMEWDQETQWAAKEAALDEEERLQSRRAECGVCLEKVKAKSRFGILMGCKHVYCLNCIREWREKSNDKECPQCRVPSNFVLPSLKLVTDPARKERLLLEYKHSLAKMPRQRFQFSVSS